MADKTSTGQTSYQGRGGNYGRGFDRGRENLYGRGQGSGFNMTKQKFRGNLKLQVEMYIQPDIQDKHTSTPKQKN